MSDSSDADKLIVQEWLARHRNVDPVPELTVDLLAELVAAGRAGLTWTATPPTKVPGWYWMRGEPDLNAVIVWVSTSGYIVRAGFPEMSTASFMRENPRGQWSVAPIPAPQEPP